MWQTQNVPYPMPYPMLNMGHRHKSVPKGIFRKDIMIHQIPCPVPCLTWDTGTKQGVTAFLKTTRKTTP